MLEWEFNRFTISIARFLAFVLAMVTTMGSLVLIASSLWLKWRYHSNLSSIWYISFPRAGKLSSVVSWHRLMFLTMIVMKSRSSWTKLLFTRFLLSEGFISTIILAGFCVKAGKKLLHRRNIAGPEDLPPNSYRRSNTQTVIDWRPRQKHFNIFFLIFDLP